jgi:hypothetical protein
MGLFPKEQTLSASDLGDAPRRMLWTREQGTRRLILVLAIGSVLWFGANAINERVLLSKHWDGLGPSLNGLTVVGTLNVRGQYDRSLFKIVAANKSSRVELTEFGWNSIFDARNGPLCDGRTSQAIDHARSVDSLVGFAMLEPLLRAEVQQMMGDRSAFKKLSADVIVQPNPEPNTKAASSAPQNLGDLITKYSGEGDSNSTRGENDMPEGGSGSGREVEHGIVLPADTVARVCPVVLNGTMFSDAWLEEQPTNIFTGKAYTVHLGLTPEGRSRFFQWSHDHANEGLVFVLNHQVVLAGRVPETLDVSQLDITNVEDEQSARQVVDWITKRKPSGS